MKKEIFYLEVSGIILSVLGFFLKLAKIGSFGSFVLSLGLGALMVVYLMYIILPHKQGYDFLTQDISKYLVSGTYSIILFGIIGLWCKFQLIDVGQSILKISSYAHLALVILLLFALRIADNITQFENTKSLLIRALAMLAIVYMFFLTPQTRLNKFFSYLQNQQKNNYIALY